MYFMKKKPLFTGGLVALLLLALVTALFHFTFPVNEKSQTQNVSLQQTEAGDPATNLGTEFTITQALPNSPTSKTDQNEAQLLEEKATFVLDYGVKDAFDRFVFEHQGEQPSVVTTKYSQHAQQHYSLTSRDYAIALFTRYVSYKVALSQNDVEVDLSSHSLSDVAYRLDTRDELRRQFFTDNEFHFLFSKDAEIDRAALARIRVARESTLSQEERKSLILEKLQNAPQAEYQAFKPTVDMHTIKQIKAKHPDLATRYNAVAAQFGNDVADRFMKTWQAQEDWDSRVKAYQNFKQQLVAKIDEEAERLEALALYEEENFTSNELKRLHVLTR
jgi:lipase chaperone LimK